MRVVLITFNCNDFNFQLLTFYFDQFFKRFSTFDIRKILRLYLGQKTKWQFIKDTVVFVCLYLFSIHIPYHDTYMFLISTYIFYFMLSIPYLREWAFRTVFCKNLRYLCSIHFVVLIYKTLFYHLTTLTCCLKSVGLRQLYFNLLVFIAKRGVISVIIFSNNRCFTILRHRYVSNLDGLRALLYGQSNKIL